MGIFINEITNEKSNSGLNSHVTLINKTEDFNYFFLNNLTNETFINQDTFINPTNPSKTEDFSFEKAQNLKTKIEKEKILSEQIIRNIDNSRTLLDQATLLNNDKLYSNVVSSSDGVLSATKGIIGLKTIKIAENKTKTIFSSVSNLVGGVGSLLMAADIPEAEFLTLTGKLIGLKVESINLKENIQKKDSRGIAGTVVSFSKSVWGAVVSGVNVTKMTVTMGANFGIVSSETFGKVTNVASKIGNITDKIAIPFAIAGTGLIFWDWRKSIKKVNLKEEEINNDILNSNFLNRQDNSLDLIKDFKTLQTNSNYMGLAFTASAISTTALITSVVFPSTAIVTGPLTVAGSIVSAVLNMLADDKNRNSLKKENYILNT